MKNIHVSNGGQSSSLRASWTPGRGDVDSFLVSLQQGARRLESRPIQKHQNQLGFTSLQPGQIYSITVVTLSGELNNSLTANARTGRRHDVMKED